jgi:diguanylate cyclase
MAVPVLIFVIAALCVFIGFGLAVAVERRSRRSRQPEAVEAGAAQTIAHEDIDSSLARELFTTLKELATSVDDNVDRHASRVTKISSELSEGSTPDAARVLAAANRLLEANKQLKSDLESARTEIRLQERQLHSYMTESRTDELTGLANRRAFEEEIGRRLAQWHRQQVPLSLVLLDVDRFKWFNDYYGHQVGDAILQRVAESLRSATRAMDLVTRYGGEEFAVILNGTELFEAKLAAERLRQAVLEDRLCIEGSELHVAVSAGVAQAAPSETKAAFLKRVDDSLYAAKNTGRNRCCFHDGESCRRVESDSGASYAVAGSVPTERARKRGRTAAPFPGPDSCAQASLTTPHSPSSSTGVM